MVTQCVTIAARRWGGRPAAVCPRLPWFIPTCRGSSPPAVVHPHQPLFVPTCRGLSPLAMVRPHLPWFVPAGPLFPALIVNNLRALPCLGLCITQGKSMTRLYMNWWQLYYNCKWISGSCITIVNESVASYYNIVIQSMATITKKECKGS